MIQSLNSSKTKDPVPKLWQCTQCSKSYSSKGALHRHLKFECGKEPKFECEFCSYRSFRKFNLFSHQRLRHERELLNTADIKTENTSTALPITPIQIKQEPESISTMSNYNVSQLDQSFPALPMSDFHNAYLDGQRVNSIPHTSFLHFNSFNNSSWKQVL